MLSVFFISVIFDCMASRRSARLRACSGVRGFCGLASEMISKYRITGTAFYDPQAKPLRLHGYIELIGFQFYEKAAHSFLHGRDKSGSTEVGRRLLFWLEFLFSLYLLFGCIYVCIYASNIEITRPIDVVIFLCFCVL